MRHKLLERQLRRIRDPGTPEGLEELLRAVSQAYEEYDRTQKLQDNASQLMSDELNALNAAILRERDEAVAATQKRFELAVEGANDGIWDWNVPNDSLWFSHRAKTMLGHAPDSMGKGGIEGWYGLVMPEDLPAAREFIRACLGGGEQQVATLRFRHLSEGVKHIMCRASVVTDDGGQAARVVGIHTDITALVLMNEELRRTKTLAESANAAKSDFLANMSHELRTPLNSILGMTRLLMESGLEKDQEDLAEMVHRSSVNLLDIVNDILDLSKIEAGEMALESVGFDPVYTFDSVLTTLQIGRAHV